MRSRTVAPKRLSAASQPEAFHAAAECLLETRRYYEAGALRQGRYDPDAQRYVILDVSGWLQGTEQYGYDADGRITYQATYQRNEEEWANWGWPWEQHHDTGLAWKTTVQYSRADGSSGYDAAGRLTTYRYTSVDIGGATHTYTRTFAGWDSYQEASVTGVSTDTNYRTTSNTLSYDAYGRLVGQRERTHYSEVPINDRQRYYAYTGDGQVQLRREGEINKDTGAFEQKADGLGIRPNFLYVHAAGQQQAELREGGQIRTVHNQLLNLGQVTLNTGGYDAGGGKVVVQAGEKLTTIAQRVYGSAQLWYVTPGNGAKANAAITSAIQAASARPNTGGVTVGPIPKVVGERPANALMCARTETRCEAEQYLYDPNEPSGFAKWAGNIIGAFRAPDANGYRKDGLNNSAPLRDNASLLSG